MVVSIDKATALRMHDKVRKHWQVERTRVEKELAKLDAFRGPRRDSIVLERIQDLRKRLATL
jgi:type I restriction enzyme R subunit